MDGEITAIYKSSIIVKEYKNYTELGYEIDNLELIEPKVVDIQEYSIFN